MSVTFCSSAWLPAPVGIRARTDRPGCAVPSCRCPAVTGADRHRGGNGPPGLKSGRPGRSPLRPQLRAPQPSSRCRWNSRPGIPPGRQNGSRGPTDRLTHVPRPGHRRMPQPRQLHLEGQQVLPATTHPDPRNTAQSAWAPGGVSTRRRLASVAADRLFEHTTAASTDAPDSGVPRPARHDPVVRRLLAPGSQPGVNGRLNRPPPYAVGNCPHSPLRRLSAPLVTHTTLAEPQQAEHLPDRLVKEPLPSGMHAGEDERGYFPEKVCVNMDAAQSNWDVVLQHLELGTSRGLRS